MMFYMGHCGVVVSRLDFGSGGPELLNKYRFTNLQQAVIIAWCSLVTAQFVSCCGLQVIATIKKIRMISGITVVVLQSYTVEHEKICSFIYRE